MAPAAAFRTDDVRKADRFAQWRDWISSTFVPLECSPAGVDPFWGRVTCWELDDLLVSRVAAGPHVAARTRRMISARDSACYKAGLLTSGLCHLSQQGREALLRPGDLAIYDIRRPYTLSFDGPHDMSFLMFGCHRLRLPTVAVDRVLAVPVSSRHGTGSLPVRHGDGRGEFRAGARRAGRPARTGPDRYPVSISQTCPARSDTASRWLASSPASSGPVGGRAVSGTSSGKARASSEAVPMACHLPSASRTVTVAPSSQTTSTARRPPTATPPGGPGPSRSRRRLFPGPHHAEAAQRPPQIGDQRAGPQKVQHHRPDQDRRGAGLPLDRRDRVPPPAAASAAGTSRPSITEGRRYPARNDTLASSTGSAPYHSSNPQPRSPATPGSTP